MKRLAACLLIAGVLGCRDSENESGPNALVQVKTAVATIAPFAEIISAIGTLSAPIAGVVTKLNAPLGASVDATQPIVEVADLSALDIIFNVSPTDAARIAPGASVTLSAGESAKGEPLGVGRIIDVGGTVDSATRSVAVRAQAPPTARPLRIGETIFGQIV